MSTEPVKIEIDGQGLRYAEGKPRYNLIPPEPMEELAHHFRRGMEKYAERNWERGMSWGHCFRAAMSHLWKFWRGEELDEETGTHHVICAAWNCFALYTYVVRGIGEDSRMKL